MADAQYEVSMNTRQLEAGAKRVEKATVGMRKSTKNGAMAFLEATRAMEDFAFAGIRGAANNLPGIAMAMGLGAGVAGAATIMALSLMAVSKTLEQYKKAANGAADASNAFADSMNKSVEKIKAYDQAQSLALRGKLTSENFASQAAQNGADIIARTQADIEKANAELDFNREIQTIGGSGQTPAEKYADDAAKQIEASRQWGRALDEITAKEKKLAETSALMESKILGSPEDIRNTMSDVAAASAELSEIQKNMEQKGFVPKGFWDWVGSTDLGKGTITLGAKLLEYATIGADLNKEFIETREKLASGDNEYTQAERDAKAALSMQTEKLAAIERELEEKKKIYEQDQANLKTMQEGAAKAQENVDNAKKRLAEAEEEARKAELRQFAAEGSTASAFDKFRMSQPSLSSLASVGLSGNETQSALASFNVQREMLVELKKHSRLLAKPRTGTATYGRG